MRKIYTTLIILICSSLLAAQTQDSLLRRELELERDFNPTLLDAEKINSLPALREPTVQKANTNYSSQAKQITPPLEIALPRPGSIMTAIPYLNKKGYASIQAGNYANIDGAFGYRILDEEKQSLAFNFTHQSTNGNVRYLQETTPKNINRFLMDNRGELDFKHLGNAHRLGMNLSYLHSLFNYYGNRFGNEPYFNNDKQKLGLLQASLWAASHEADLVNYHGKINFKNFNTALAYPATYKALKGNEIELNAGISKPFKNHSTLVGLDGSLITAIYGGDWDNYLLLDAAPYLLYEGVNSLARLGVDILFQTGDKTRVRVAPNVALKWGITDRTSAYANIGGRFNHNTFLGMMQESRYILPTADVKPSFTVIDITAGFKIGALDGFRFDLFGGFRKTETEHFLVLKGTEVIGGDAIGRFVEALSPLYGDLSHSRLGGMIHTKIWAPLDLSLRIQKNFYKVKEFSAEENISDNIKAYNKPGMEIDLKGSLAVNDRLHFNIGYYFLGDRWSYFNGSNQKMDNINDLNLGASYKINDTFSINLKGCNLINQQYDLWYGHPAQGISLMGGLTLLF